MQEKKTQKPAEKQQKRIPRTITKKRLNNIALYYLQRFVSSSENLRRVLHRRIDKAAKFHEMDKEEAFQWVDEIIKNLEELKFLNDEDYARFQVQGMHRQGRSRRYMIGKLKMKGVAQDHIDKALEILAQDNEDTELSAAVTLAKRKKLGPFGAPKDREDNYKKHLGTFARNGFSYDIARKILEADDVEEFSDLAV